jgi:multidrug transporter EmrE-like cation transporter
MMLACLLVSAALACGQILFKQAAIEISAKWSINAWAAVLSPWLGSALVLYALATALWVFVLAHIPLNKAYPVVIVATAVVPFASHWIFGEVLSTKYLMGLSLMLVGLTLIQTA